MWKWFAPLLIFAGKPEVLLRLVTLAVAAAALAFGVWLLSRVALTFDALKNPYIEVTYGVVLACFFIGVGTVTWLRVRRLGMQESTRRAAPAPEAPPLSADVVNRRAEEIARKWSRDRRFLGARVRPRGVAVPVSATPPAQARNERKVRGTLAVTGPAYSGKTALIASLVQETSTIASDKSEIVRLADAGAIDGDDDHLAAVLAACSACDGILFVIDQDLRAPEAAAIAKLTGSGKPLHVVLNKSDQFTAADRDAILVSIRAKMPSGFAPSHVICVAGAPSPIEREIEDARGAVRVELRRPASDLRALTSLLARIYASAPGQALKFEAA